MKSASDYWQSVLAAAVVVAAGAAVYSSTLSAPFVYDDLGAVLSNTDLHRFDFTKLDNYFGVRALPQLTLALNWRLSGVTTTGYHAVNLAIHVLSSLVLWRLAGLLLGRRGIAPLFAALLFAVHPLQTEAVTYISQRITLMATFFYLTALWAYARWRLQGALVPHPIPSPHLRRGGTTPAAWWVRSVRAMPWAALSLLAAFAAMNSKEIAFTLPLAIVWLELCFFGQQSVRRTMVRLLPWLLLLLYIPWLMFGSSNTAFSNQPAPASEATTVVPVVANTPAGQVSALPRQSYLFTQFSVFLNYLRLIVWPAGQNIDHDPAVYYTLLAWRPPFAQATGGKPALGLAVLILLAVVAIRSRRVNPLLAFGLGFFLLTWALESTFYPLVELMVEYRMYLPLAGVSLAAGALLAAILGRLGADQRPARQDGGQAALGIAGVLLILLAIAALSRNGLWRDPVLLWQDAAAKSPQRARPVHNLGSIYLETGQYALAQHYLERAVALDPYRAVAHANLGTALMQQGRLAEAERHMRTAMRLKPDLAAIAGNLAQLYIQQGRWDEAKALLEEALARDPRSIAAHNALGIVFVQRGDVARARVLFEAALELDPNFTAARKNLKLLPRDLP